MNSVTIKADTFILTLIPSAFETLPIVKLRKIFKLLFLHAYENADSIPAIENVLAKITQDAKLEFAIASKEFQNNFRTTDSKGYFLSKEQQEKINRPLVSLVKKAKAPYDRAAKIQTIFIQLKEKYNYG